MINIKGLDKVEVVVALYTHSRHLGLGFLQAGTPLPDVRAIIDSGQTYFDYLNGKVMKVEVGGDELDPRLFDRDNGEGAAARAIASVPGLRCVGCGKAPAELTEYVDAAEDGETPNEYVCREEGTYNPANGHFLCTSCYIKAGTPLGVAP